MPYQLDIPTNITVLYGNGREKAVTRSLVDLIYEKIIKNVVFFA